MHTSANLAGPLRLRLYVSGTQFIVRYRMLQEGLITLHVDESQDFDETGKSILLSILFLTEHFPSDISQHDENNDENHFHEDACNHGEGMGEQEASVGVLEGQESQYENDRDHVHDYDEVSPEDGEVAGRTGEIDLSTLPDFVESPEAAEEAEQELNIESTDAPNLETARSTLGGAPNSGILDGEVSTAEPYETDQNQENLFEAGGIASENLGGRHQEDTRVKLNGAEDALGLQSDEGALTT